VTLLGLDARSVGSSPWAHSLPIGAWQTGFSNPPDPYSFVFANPVASFRMFLNALTSDLIARVHLVGGGVEWFAVSPSGGSADISRFAGFVASTNAITRIDFYSSNYQILDDVEFGVLPNHPPVAVDDVASVNEDASVNVGVLANDSDPDGNTLVVTGAVGATTDGTTVTYTPPSNYCGPATVGYSISDGNGGTASANVNVTVACVQDPPDAVDDTVSFNQGTSASIPVLSNDLDVDGDALQVTGVSGGNGSASTDGVTVNWTPPIAFCGPRTLTYSVSDGHGGTDSAAINATVVCVDSDSDGVADSIDSGASAFSASPTTAGSITSVPAGFSVLIEDAPDPDGVRVRVEGTGPAKVVLSLCGGFTFQVGAGTDAVLTCGSLLARVIAGVGEFVLNGGATVVQVTAGSTAKVAAAGAGYTVLNQGGTGQVSVITNGVTFPVSLGAGPALIDLIAPTLTTAGALTYTVDQVVVLTCAATDASGIASSTCPSLINAKAHTFPLGNTTVVASATDTRGNTASKPVTFAVRVTPTSLCTLTKQFTQTSPAYLRLSSFARLVVDALVTATCKPLDTIVASLSPANKAAAISAYKSAVTALVPTLLTTDQANKLKGFADAL
jgi:hypothetical protein